MFWIRALVASLSILTVPGTAYAAGAPFTATGQIQEARYEASGVQIAGGALMIAGYSYQSGDPLRSVERFDLETGKWSLTGSLKTPRTYANAITLPDGHVLAAGGQTRMVQPIASTELYDPRAKTWSDGPDLSVGRTELGLMVLDDGRVLAVGGNQFDPVGAEVLNLARDEWEPTGKTSALRYNAALVKLKDGKVLAAGGWSSSGLDYTVPSTYHTSAEIYDPATNAWTAVAPMHRKRYAPAGAILPDGRVLIASGREANSPFTETASSQTYEIYDPATNSWSDPKPLLSPRAAAGSLVTLSDGRLVHVGGSTSSRGVDTADVYDPRTDTWTVSIPLGTERSSAIAVALPDDSVLVTSGFWSGWSSQRLNPNWTPPVTATPTPDPTPTPTPVAEVKVEPTPTPTPDAKPAPGKATVTIAKTLKTSRAGALSLKVSCAGASACPKQRLTLRVRGGKLLARADVSLPAGASRTVTLKLKRADRRKRTLKVAITFAGATYNRSLQVR
ncbi:hypothetical protein OJ998_13755 [Solirubrobacter taibaiensis]|nr:hypothetical protein [Solirubrobacter taibaiensis]